MALVLGTRRSTRKAVTGVLSKAGCISMWVCGFLKDASHQRVSQGRMCRTMAPAGDQKRPRAAPEREVCTGAEHRPDCGP